MHRVLAASVLVSALLVAPAADARVGLLPIGRFASPTYVTAPPDDTRRLFVVQRRGAIRLVEDGRTRRRPFVDLTRHTLVRDGEGTSDQRGMLSMAFAPDYTRTGRFYVFYVDRQDRIRVDELRRSAGDPRRADPRSRRAILTLPDAGPLHHGGQLAFGPDGLLYVGIGFGDDEAVAQDPASLRGKIVRLDPAAPRPEIVVSGLRNPYRFSFDRPTGDLYVADVGGDRAEEMTRLPRGRQLGANLGWPVFEGNVRLTDTPLPGAIAPTLTRPHGDAWCSIVGGHVARDPAVPELRGRYVHGDVCSGRVYAGGSRLALQVPYLVSFGQDARNRLYAVSLAGRVWRLVRD